jgi:hypothetical protein
MSTSRIIPGSQYFADPAVGRPAANANVYIGAPNTDPFILANRVTVDVIKQDGSTVSIPPASQPLHTTGGGLLAYNGSAVQAQYSGGDYSISLRNSNDALLDYFPRVSSPFSADAPTLQADNFYTNDVSSASNAYVIIPPVSPAPDSLLDGQEITFRPSDNGSSSATINVIGNGGPIGAKQWVLSDGTSDVPNDYVKTSRDYKVRYKASTGKMVDQDLGLFSNNPSIQAWNTHIDYYKVPSYVTGSDTFLYKSISQTGPNLGGSHNPVGDGGVHWGRVVENISPASQYNGSAGHIYGLTLSNDGGTPATIIDISAGSARDSTNTIDMVASTTWTKKINAVWASGTGNGGFPSTLTAGAPVNNTWYSFWEISKPDGTVDFGFDSAANGVANTPTLLQVDAPAYTLFRRIGWVRYGAATIVKFFQSGSQFTWDVQSQDLTGGNNTTGVALTVLAPPLCSADIQATMTDVTGGGIAYVYALLTETQQTNSAPTAALYDLYSYFSFGQYAWAGYMSKSIVTDSSSQIRYRQSALAGSAALDVFTVGWVDKRGQY